MYQGAFLMRGLEKVRAEFPITVLLQCHTPVAGQLQAGDQVTGDGGAAAQRSFWRAAIDLRQKGRQQAPIRQLSQQPGQRLTAAAQVMNLLKDKSLAQSSSCTGTRNQ
jgi:hypothetical protein